MIEMAKVETKHWFRLHGWPTDTGQHNHDKFGKWHNVHGFLVYASSKEHALKQFPEATIARITNLSYKAGLNADQRDANEYADWFGIPAGDPSIPLNERKRGAAGGRKVAIPGEQIALDYLRSYNGNFGFLLDLKERASKWRLSAKQVAAVLRCMENDNAKVNPIVEKAVKPKTEPAGEGWYEYNGVVYKVKKAVHGSGRLYAVGLNDGEWEYAPGVANRLREEHRLSMERAQELGRLYGWCVICGKTLTDEKSIEAGIGPVCIKRFESNG